MYDNDLKPPSFVQGVPRLGSDLSALAKLFAPGHPPRRVIRADNVLITLYGFGDASGDGFGSTMVTPSGLRYRYGLWGRDLSYQSSNYREMRNLVDLVALELEDNFPVLEDMVSSITSLVEAENKEITELFLFTDNSVAEGAFFRGTSSNPKLFSLILRLRALEMHHSLRIHVVHISGKRMIMQGTDGLSRGDLNAGIMRGENMLTFVPLHRGALDRSPDLLQWIQLWSPNRLLRPLSPLEWFTLGHGVTSYSVNTDGVTVPVSRISPQTVLVWSPPPAAAKAALDELSVARHKWPHPPSVFMSSPFHSHLAQKVVQAR